MNHIHTPFLIMTIAITFALTMTINSVKSAAEDDMSAFSTEQKEELGGLIHGYIMDNPGIIIEAVEKFRSNQEAEEQKLAQKKLGENKAFLHDDPLTPTIGNPDADVTIVEFFDYNCGYCKKALSDVSTLLEQDDNIRVVLKDMPILSEASRTASEWALAANKQGKYWEYHQAIMKHSGNKSEKILEKLTKEIGLDVKKLRKDANDPAIGDLIDKNLKAARELGINGTPGFVIGDNIARGYIGIEAMQDMIKAIRENKGQDTP